MAYTGARPFPGSGIRSHGIRRKMPCCPGRSSISGPHKEFCYDGQSLHNKEQTLAKIPTRDFSDLSLFWETGSLLATARLPTFFFSHHEIPGQIPLSWGTWLQWFNKVEGHGCLFRTSLFLLDRLQEQIHEDLEG